MNIKETIDASNSLEASIKKNLIATGLFNYSLRFSSKFRIEDSKLVLSFVEQIPCRCAYNCSEEDYYLKLDIDKLDSIEYLKGVITKYRKDELYGYDIFEDDED